MLLHIHRAARPFPVDAWYEHVEITGKIAGEAFGGACLYCEVELSLQRSAQLAYNLDGPVAPDLGCLPLGEMGKMLENAQIGVDFRCDAGSAIFRMTGVPLASVARCIWAIEAAAYGSRSRLANTSNGERPSADRPAATDHQTAPAPPC